MLRITVGFNQSLKSLSVNFLHKWLNILIEQYYISMRPFRKYKRQIWVFKSPSAEKTIAIFFLTSNLNRGTEVFVFSQTLYFCSISLIILYPSPLSSSETFALPRIVSLWENMQQIDVLKKLWWTNNMGFYVLIIIIFSSDALTSLNW